MTRIRQYRTKVDDGVPVIAETVRSAVLRALVAADEIENSFFIRGVGQSETEKIGCFCTALRQALNDAANASKISRITKTSLCSPSNWSAPGVIKPSQLRFLADYILEGTSLAKTAYEALETTMRVYPTGVPVMTTPPVWSSTSTAGQETKTDFDILGEELKALRVEMSSELVGPLTKLDALNTAGEAVVSRMADLAERIYAETV